MVDVLKIGLIIAGIIVLIRFKVALSLTLFARPWCWGSCSSFRRAT